jgi:hypothetical protein
MNDVHEPGVRYGVVLATNQYAGNFERQLTAYCTGRTGECGVGEDLVPLFLADLHMTEDDFGTVKDPFWDAIVSLPDEHGCARPCSIYRGKNNYNDLVIYFSEPATKEQVAVIASRAKAYADDERIAIVNEFDAQPELQILDVYLIKVQTTVEEYRLL